MSVSFSRVASSWNTDLEIGKRTYPWQNLFSISRLPPESPSLSSQNSGRFARRFAALLRPKNIIGNGKVPERVAMR
jgi:hypothetical protein